MRRIVTIVLGLLATVFVLAVVAVFVLTNTNWGREQIRVRVVDALNGSANGVVKVGRISGNLLKGLTLHDVSITDSTGAPFVAIDEVSAGYGLRSLISKKIQLNDVRLVRPVIVLDRRPGGQWNYERIFPSDTTSEVKDTTKLAYGDWLVFTDARIVQGQFTIRTPWSPDSALAGAARDSAVAAALAADARTVVVRVPEGFQQVQEFRAIDATLPLVRLAHPDHATRLVDVDSLRAQVAIFRQPADVRQIAGVFELDADSLWFRETSVQLPASNAALQGRYAFESGDLALRAQARPIALADIQFAYPPLPDSGQATFDLALTMADGRQSYLVRALDLRTGTATATGDIGLTLGDTLQIHQTDVTFAGIQTRLIEQLVPTLDVPRSGVLAGRAKVDGTLASMQVDGDVTFDDDRSGTSRVLAVGELGTENGVFRARDLRVRLTPVQVDLVRIAVADFPLGGTVSGTATLDGSTATRLTARGLDLTHLDRGQRSRFTGSGAVRLGEPLYVDMNLQARPLSLVTVGRFAPAAGLRGSVSGPIRATGTLADLAINSTLRSSDGGSISARGRLDLASQDIGYNLDVATTLFNANALVAKAPRTSLSAELSARGRGFDPATMRAELAADLTTSTIDTVAVDSSSIRVAIANGMADVRRFVARAPGAFVEALGTFGLAKTQSGKLDYRVHVDSIALLARYLPLDTGLVAPRPGPTAERLARARADSARTATRLAVARAAGEEPPGTPIVVDTPPALKRDTLAGAAYTAGQLVGGLGGFDVRGRLGTVGLLAMGNAVQRARAEYSWTGALTESSTIVAALVADSVSAAGFALDSLDARVTYRKPGGTAIVSIFQNTERDYGMRAEYAIYNDRKELRFSDLRLRFDSTRWVSTQPGSILWGQPGIEIANLELRNRADGRIFADGTLPTEGAANLRLEVANFQVGDLLGLLQSDVQARGLLTLNTTVSGTGRAPIVNGTVAMNEGMFRGTALPDLRSTFDYAALRLTARADVSDSGRTLATASGVVPINLALQGVTGPRLATDAPVTADVRMDSVPLDLASRFTDAISNVRGFARGTASVRGPMNSPEITGDLALASAQMRVVPLGVTLRRMNGALRLRGDTVVIDSITADSDGRLSVRGGIGIAQLAAPSFDLRLAADNARVLDSEQGKIRADAQVAVYGPFDGVFVSGGARVREGVLYIPKTDNKEVINAGDPAVFAVVDTSEVDEDELVPAQSPLLSNLRMDLSLGVDRDTWVRSQEANVEIYSDGDLRINIDRRRQAITLDGIVNTDRGEYSFLSKRFQIKRGSARFVGTQELNPLLQLAGEYEVKQAGRQALFIRILIGGTLQSPRLTLESDAQPPISQSDLLSYLAFGGESGSLLQFGGSSVSGGTAGGGLIGTSAALATRQLTAVALGVAVQELEGEAARSLGADVINITPANVPTEIASGNFGALGGFLQSTQLEFGKYFTTQTFVGLNIQPVLVFPGFRVEHRFRRQPGLSVESTLQPRFFLPEPSLDPEQSLNKKNAFGLFLVRRWKF